MNQEVIKALEAAATTISELRGLLEKLEPKKDNTFRHGDRVSIKTASNFIGEVTGTMLGEYYIVKIPDALLTASEMKKLSPKKAERGAGDDYPVIERSAGTFYVGQHVWSHVMGQWCELEVTYFNSINNKYLLKWPSRPGTFSRSPSEIRNYDPTKPHP